MPNPPLSRSSMQLQRLALALFIAMLGLLIGVFSLIDFQQARKNEEEKLSTQAGLVSTNLQLHMRSANHVLEETLALLDFIPLEQGHPGPAEPVPGRCLCRAGGRLH